MDRVKKLYIVTLVLILGGGSIAMADDLVPPPWRGEEGSTYQAWEFDTAGENGLYVQPDQGWNNPYGTPGLNVDTPHQWIPTFDQRTGIWPLSGEIDIEIPNTDGGPEKYIRIQLTWKSAEGVIDPKKFVPYQPILGVTTSPFYDSMTIARINEQPLDDGWMHWTFQVHIVPNPSIEWLTIKGNILVDELVIDTMCIPEPTTVALLGVGGLLCIRRRKRS